jgi:glycosyltransferase involved in cell wall biosynthesis
VRVLHVFSSALGIGGVAQVGLNMAEAFEVAGHESWVYVHPRPSADPMHADTVRRLRSYRIDPLGRFRQRLARVSAPSEFDLVIYHAARKTARNTPVFDGPAIVVHHTQDSGFQSPFLDRFRVQRIVFVSDFERRHFLLGENLDVGTNRKGESVEESWLPVRALPPETFVVQHPPMSEAQLDRRVRTSLGRFGQLLKATKIRSEWHESWFPVLTERLNEVVPTEVEIDGIRTHEQRRAFWNRADGVVWASSTKETFGLNLHEAIFCGCVPLVLRKNDATMEIVEEHDVGFRFDTPEELLERAAQLRDDPALVEEHSRRALAATEHLRYDGWAETFLSKLNLGS